MFGVINIYKPKGLTSHDVVNAVRKVFGIKQVGHTGTLDPFAEGVLPICIGKATKLIEYFDDDKEYLATIKLGTATTTYDIEGEVTKTSCKKIIKEDFFTELSNFQGEIKQLPPAYSAIKVNGKKLYEYARSGETINVAPREVTIYKIELLNFNEKEQLAEIKIKCSKGTYIRSIANDIGENLGCYAHLIKLVRTGAGRFCIENSTPLPIEVLPKSEDNKFVKYNVKSNAKEILENKITNPIDMISAEKININNEEYEKVIHGNSIQKPLHGLNSGDFLILIYNDCIVATGQYIDNKIKVKKVFV